MKIVRSDVPIWFFSKEEKKSIEKAIADAENMTSGEIRVHVEGHAGDDIRERARIVFEKIGMTKTDARNGVLIYFATKSRTFAVIGDSGIDKVVPDDFWDSIVDAMMDEFKGNRFAGGIEIAVNLIGQKLREYFPHQKDDQNELPDIISFGF